MNYKSKIMLALSLFAGWALFTLPAFGQAPVVVTNNASHPVPVVAQGTTNVSGTVNVGNTPNVSIANTPSVNIATIPNLSIASMPSVNIAGSPAVTNPLDGQNNPKPLATLEAIQPYEDGCAISISSPTNTGNCTFRAIPAGKRLIIEEFDAFGYNDTGIKPVQMAVNPAGYVTHNFALTYISNSWGHDNFATHQPTRMYAPSIAQPVCGVTLSAAPSSATYFCALSGFLVDVP